MSKRTLVVTWCSDWSGPHDCRAAVTLVQTEAPGDDKSGARYDVKIGEKTIGEVRSWRESVYKKIGRLRGSLIGKPLVWGGEVTGQIDRVYGGSRMAYAVERVCARAATAGLFTPENIGTKGKKS